MADKIQVDYQALARLATDNRRQAEAMQALYRKIDAQAEVLAASWIGESAKTFQTEMREVLLPAVERLYQGLELAGGTVDQISARMRAGEDEAAALFAAGGAGGFLSGVGDFFSGAWSELKDMAGGLWQMVTDPVGSAKGLWFGVTHPSALWDAFKKPYVDAWESGHPWQAVGRGTLFIGSVVIGTKGLDKLGKIAGVTGKAGELGRAGEVADIARAGEAADAARLAEAARAGELSEAGKVGRVAGLEGRQAAEEGFERVGAESAEARVTSQAGMAREIYQAERVPLGRVPAGEMPSPNLTPSKFGDAMQERVGPIVREKFPDVEFRPQTPSGVEGPDLRVAPGGRDPGFDWIEIKPDTQSGMNTFMNEEFGKSDVWSGRGRIVAYDKEGNVRLINYEVSTE